MATLFCSPTFLLLIFLFSAIPVGLIISLERNKHSTHTYEYYSNGWIREGNKWDDVKRRFIVTNFEGGVSQISVPEDHTPGTILNETRVVQDADLEGKASLGVFIDRPRNRLLVVYADLKLKKYLYGGLAAYDLDSWERVYLTQLSGPDDGYSFADDVAVDAEGNAYVTDCKATKIWKVGVDGEKLSVIKSPLFTQKEWHRDLVTLNGIVYHSDGFLLVIHTTGGKLFKIDIATEKVKVVKVDGSLTFGDGIELLSPTKLVVAACYPSGRIVESFDGWETATVVSKFRGPIHRLAASATVKDGKVYINHMLGLGLTKRTHTIIEAVFSPVKSTSS